MPIVSALQTEEAEDRKFKGTLSSVAIDLLWLLLCNKTLGKNNLKRKLLHFSLQSINQGKPEQELTVGILSTN